jgi:hypothetical protein
MDHLIAKTRSGATLMTAIVTSPIVRYLAGDGKLFAEALDHLYVILMHQLEAELTAERSRSEELQATLDRYREQFGEL